MARITRWVPGREDPIAIVNGIIQTTAFTPTQIIEPTRDNYWLEKLKAEAEAEGFWPDGLEAGYKNL